MTLRLFHVSENPGIQAFKPRPSPSYVPNITRPVVYAINDILLHNYLLPRDCPRVAFYAKSDTTQMDQNKFFRNSKYDFVVAIEKDWYPIVRQAKLYCYEFPIETFEQIDEGAGYYISYKEVAPISMHQLSNVQTEFTARNAELRIVPTLWDLAEEVRQSSLQYSLIRMRNAIRPDPRPYAYGQIK